MIEAKTLCEICSQIKTTVKLRYCLRRKVQLCEDCFQASQFCHQCGLLKLTCRLCDQGEGDYRFLCKECRAEVARYLESDLSDEEIGEGKGFLYVIGSDSLYKIGRTIRPSKRLAALQSSSPIFLKFALVVVVEQVQECEKEMHRLFSRYRTKGEWFKLEEGELSRLRRKMLSIGIQVVCENFES